MTAKEFYGPAYKTLRLAEKQVLEKIRMGEQTWKKQGEQGTILYTKSRIKSPESMCRKLASRGLPVTREAALTEVRDAVGVRVICAFQHDVYQVAQPIPRRMATGAIISSSAFRKGPARGRR